MDKKYFLQGTEEPTKEEKEEEKEGEGQTPSAE